MGMSSEYNTGENNICSELGFSFQHNIQLLDDGSLLFLIMETLLKAMEIFLHQGLGESE